mmetsp:Transcript_48880/g.109695  ORF Transcript_48880/g.109695 Transcript_48880/m.109695 type:complete len:187 (+) Transcript_48880:64-624(+)
MPTPQENGPAPGPIRGTEALGAAVLLGTGSGLMLAGPMTALTLSGFALHAVCREDRTGKMAREIAVRSVLTAQLARHRLEAALRAPRSDWSTQLQMAGSRLQEAACSAGKLVRSVATELRTQSLLRELRARWTNPVTRSYVRRKRQLAMCRFAQLVFWGRRLLSYRPRRDGRYLPPQPQGAGEGEQ